MELSPIQTKMSILKKVLCLRDRKINRERKEREREREREVEKMSKGREKAGREEMRK